MYISKMKERLYISDNFKYMYLYMYYIYVWSKSMDWNFSSSETAGEQLSDHRWEYFDLEEPVQEFILGHIQR